MNKSTVSLSVALLIAGLLAADVWADPIDYPAVDA